RPESANINNAPSDATSPDSSSNKPTTVARNNPPGDTPSPDSAANKPTTVARTNPPVNSAPANSATTPAANTPTRPAPTPATNPGLSASVGEAPAATPSGFLRFRDPKIGYSFDYPDYWTGQPLSEKEASDQRMNAGATFSSEKDAAYLNVIWNEVDRATNPTDENDVVGDGILNGMSTSDGISKLEETARRVENRNGFIKTYIDLRAAVQIQGQSVPLDCL